VHRLYVPHTSRSALEIIDTEQRRVVASVTGLEEIKGIALTSDPNTVFTSQAGGRVSVVDVSGARVLDTIQTGGEPDAIEYDEPKDLIAVSLGDLKKLAFIDRTTHKVTATVDLPGSPELMAIDVNSGKVYIAIHDKDEIGVVDPATLDVNPIYKGCDIKAPTGIIFDESQGLMFVASTKQLNIVDVLVDKCKGAIDLGSGTDQIAFNRHRHHVYTANGGSGNITVVDSVSLLPLGIVGTGPGASTIAADNSEDNVYVAVARSGVIAVFHDP
jgi:DNA-binding beta-propeller fold protein YncE